MAVDVDVIAPVVVAALVSGNDAVAAIDAGRFADEITPLAYRVTTPASGTDRRETRERTFSVDEGPRRDTSPEALRFMRVHWGRMTQDDMAACLGVSRSVVGRLAGDVVPTPARGYSKADLAAACADAGHDIEARMILAISGVDMRRNGR